MKKLMKIFLGLSAFCIMLTFTACENYLEFPRVLSFNEDSVFVKRINTEKFLAQMYNYNYAQMPFQTSRLDRSLLDAASDIGSGLYVQSAYGAHRFNKGTALPEWISNDGGNMGEDIYSLHYVAIRIGWKLLARTDEVPDATPAQKNIIKGEAKTLIAMHYFELMKRYGGVPLVKKAFESTAESVVPRSSFEDTYKYIVQLCDEVVAMSDYPDVISLSATNDFGRASKALAMGIKARTLLFAASPLFNNETPYLDNLGSNSNLICLMKKDNELWKQAADAAKATIDGCEAQGYALTSIGDVNKNYTAAYTYLPSKGNTEMIMPYLLGSSYLNNFRNWKPRGDNFSGYSSNVPTHNFVEMFQTKTGAYRSWETDTITPVNDPTYPYKNLDPRFNQLISYNGFIFPEGPNVALQIWDAQNGIVAQGGVNGRRNNAQFAHYLNKYIYGYVNNTDFGVPNNWRPFTPYMRLTEMYLNLAEALNEYTVDENTKPTSEVYQRINAIRQRSGMPDVDEAVFNTKAKMRTLIQNERAIEIGFEDTRFFDLKRWKMGDTFKGPIYDLKVTKLTTNKYTYKKYIYEVRPWFIHYYLHPFPPSEVNKQKGIIQNPGW